MRAASRSFSGALCRISEAKELSDAGDPLPSPFLPPGGSTAGSFALTSAHEEGELRPAEEQGHHQLPLASVTGLELLQGAQNRVMSLPAGASLLPADPSLLPGVAGAAGSALVNLGATVGVPAPAGAAAGGFGGGAHSGVPALVAASPSSSAGSVTQTNSPLLTPESMPAPEPLISWHGFEDALPSPWGGAAHIPVLGPDFAHETASAGYNSPCRGEDDRRVQRNMSEPRAGRGELDKGGAPSKGLLGKLKKSFLGRSSHQGKSTASSDAGQKPRPAEQVQRAAMSSGCTPPLVAGGPECLPALGSRESSILHSQHAAYCGRGSLSLRHDFQPGGNGGTSPLAPSPYKDSEALSATSSSPSVSGPQQQSRAFMELYSGPLPPKHLSGPLPSSFSGPFSPMPGVPLPQPRGAHNPPHPQPQQPDAQTLIGIAPGASPAALEAYLKAKAARQRRSGKRVVKVVEVPME